MPAGQMWKPPRPHGGISHTPQMPADNGRDDKHKRAHGSADEQQLQG